MKKTIHVIVFSGIVMMLIGLPAKADCIDFVNDQKKISSTISNTTKAVNKAVKNVEKLKKGIRAARSAITKGKNAEAKRKRLLAAEKRLNKILEGLTIRANKLQGEADKCQKGLKKQCV